MGSIRAEVKTATEKEIECECHNEGWIYEGMKFSFDDDLISLDNIKNNKVFQHDQNWLEEDI
jgi:hypothetical protein